jgi:hypothetical protein
LPASGGENKKTRASEDANAGSRQRLVLLLRKRDVALLNREIISSRLELTAFAHFLKLIHR